MLPALKSFAPAALLSALLLGACAVGPDYQRPALDRAERYGVDAVPGETVAAPVPGGDAQRFLAGQDLPERWWTLFGSERLNNLVMEALASSPQVKSAQAALKQAQADVRIKESYLYPTVDASFGGVRQKIDSGSFGNPNGGSTIYNLFHASVDVSYGIDLFGATRRGVESVLAQSEFRRYQGEAVYRTLVANVVTAAVQEAMLRTLIQGQEAVVADQQKSLKVSETQLELGAIGRAELSLAQSQLATELARLPPLRQQLSVVQNQLAVYLGRLPGHSAASNFELSELKLPTELPVSLPSTLVERRPDVLAAEASLRAASAGVGLAQVRRLPQLSLSASYGTQATKMSDLGNTTLWSLGGNLTAPILHFGELKAQLKGARAAYEQAEADYRLTVLNAFRDVANALRQVENDAELLRAQSLAATAAEESLKLTKAQYELGAVSYLQLLTAQQQQVQAHTGYVQALAARLQDTAALFQALGGGWTAAPADSAATPPAPQPVPVAATP